MSFHLFAGGMAVSHAYAHIVEFGKSVEIAGLSLSPGDLLHADMHGVLCVPKEITAQIPETVAGIRAHERHVIDLCRSAEFSIERLRHAVKEL